ncbi:MAG: CopD family protein [Chloroflexi bacterium]|nr:CopD family protein [Chloroflexota bacterium]
MIWRRRALSAAAGILLALFLAAPGIALAHAHVIRSDPAADLILPSSPRLIHLWTDEDLNGSLSRIVVWDRYRHVVTVGDAHLVPGQARQFEVGLKPLAPGSYLVLWTTVSAEDGHVLRGYYSFSVKEQGPLPSLVGVSAGGAGQGFPDTTTLAALLAHWIELLAAVSWAGIAAFSALVFPVAAARLDGTLRQAEYRRVRTLVWLSLALLVAASVVVLLTQAYSVTGDWGAALAPTTFKDIFAEQYGEGWIGRLVVVIVALVLSLRISVRSAAEQSPSEGAAVLTITGFVYLYAFAASGHAASAHIGVLPGTHSDLFSVSIFLDWLHFLADALWLGGQIYIVLVLMPMLDLRRKPCHHSIFLQTLNRFSPFAYASIASYVVTGGFSGKVHIPSWYAFFHSVYGWALVVKMSLIGLMMLTSAYTVYFLRPRLRRALEADGIRLMKRLLAWLRVNPVLGGGVLLVTSVMFYYPVPPGLAPAGPSSYLASSGGLTARVVLTPDHAGPNRITVSLRDRRGKPVTQGSVTVISTMLDMVMGSNLTPLTQTAPGTYTGTTDLGMGGRWGLELLAYQPSGLTRLRIDVQVGT